MKTCRLKDLSTGAEATGGFLFSGGVGAVEAAAINPWLFLALIVVTAVNFYGLVRTGYQGVKLVMAACFNQAARSPIHAALMADKGLASDFSDFVAAFEQDNSLPGVPNNAGMIIGLQRVGLPLSAIAALTGTRDLPADLPLQRMLYGMPPLG